MAFNMKGSPMHRNFGIGSPAKQKTDDPDGLTKLGLTEITDKDLDADVQFENLPASDMKRITRKYMQGEKLTEADQVIMDNYLKSQSNPSDSTTTKSGPPQRSKFKNHGVDAGASTSGAGPVKPGSNAIQ